jgi:hypothetical protein
MTYEITANNKTYIVHPHAINRMRRRGISEEMVVETMETGGNWQQENGRDVYEKEFYDEGVGEAYFVRVVVEEDMLLIVSVHVKEGD